MRISDLVERQAYARPDHPAMTCADGTVTWSQLDRRVDALVRTLDRLPPGARVAVLTKSCHRHWEAILASSRAGLVAVPLNYRWLATETAQVLHDCGASGLVVQLDMLSDEGADVILSADSLEVVLGFAGQRPGVLDYETAIRANSGATTADHMVRPESPINVLGYTSGTTGRPKGAALTTTAAVMSALWFTGVLGLEPSSTFLACMPIYVYRGGAAGLAPLVTGARTILQDFDAAAIVDTIERERVTHCILAPVMVDRLLATPDIAQRDLSSLRGVWVGGAPSHADTVQRLQELVGDIVGSTYGGTEATGVAVMRWPSDPGSSHLLRSVGRPSPLLDVRLLRADGTESADGEPGELTVRGETVMAGYWPEVSGSGLVDGWYHTGDIATRDADGYLYIVDRRVDIINSAGLNVYSNEVEAVLLDHPAVGECAVVAAPDASLGETVAAFVVATYDVTIADLSEHCRLHLAGYKRPRLFTLTSSLPRNAMGKIDKAAVRASLWRGLDRSVGGAAPRPPD